MIGRPNLTNESWKIQARLSFPIVLLAKEILQIFLGDAFFLTVGVALEFWNQQFLMTLITMKYIGSY